MGIKVDGLLLMLVVLLSLTSSQELRTPCPSPCECSEHLVDCSLRSLTEIPRDLPDTTIVLTAAHNDLTTITTKDFPRTRPNLQSLYLNNNTIRYLEIDAFGKLDNLKMLDLQGNLIRAIEPRTFISNKNIIKLVLSSNEIYKLDLGTFEGLDGLEDLRLDKNTIKTIDSNAFRHSPRLKKLVVSWNTDLNLPVEGLYFSTPSLTWLEMDHCNLSSLSLHAFDNMTNLSYLRLKGNRLQREDLRAIRRLRSLKFLHLENNAVGYVHPNTFDDISLEWLYLRGNGLYLVRNQAFLMTPSLIMLDLSMCGIVNFPPGALQHFKILQGLVLSQNHLKTFFINSELDHLESLDLSQNTIEAINSEMFKTLRGLKYLDVSFNDIDTIESDAFIYNTVLSTLDLKENKLLSTYGLLFDVPSLVSLDISACGITHLSTDTFQNMDNLRVLKMSNNAIESLNFTASLRNLTALDLSRNSFVELYGHFFYGLPNLAYLNMSDNPLLCDNLNQTWFWCSDIDIRVYANCPFFNYFHGNSNSSTCEELRIEEMNNADKKLQPANRMLPSVKRGDKLTARVDNQSEFNHETDVEVFSGMSKNISKGDFKFFGDFDVFNESLEFNQSSRSLQTTIEKYTFLTIIYVATGAASIIIFIFLITLSLDCFIAKRRYKVLKRKASKKTAEGKSSLEFQKNKRKSNTSQSDASRTKAPELKPLQGNFRRQNPQGRKSQRPRQRDSISSRSGGDNPRYITSSVNVDDVEPTTYRPHELWSRQFREHAESSVNGTPPPYVESLTPTDMTDSPSRPPQPWGRQFSGETVGESVQAGSESPRFFTSVSGSTLSSPASPKYPAHNLWSRQFR